MTRYGIGTPRSCHCRTSAAIATEYRVAEEAFGSKSGQSACGLRGLEVAHPSLAPKVRKPKAQGNALRKRRRSTIKHQRSEIILYHKAVAPLWDIILGL